MYIQYFLLIDLLKNDIYYFGMSCTTAVISGKHTKDGRPILWKLRDTEKFENKIMFFDEGKYQYIGLVDSDDKEGTQIWGGANSEGFSIINSASFNVNLENKTDKKDLEGYFMKKALQSCNSLSDFEQLLDKEPKPMGLAAHFGVIDNKDGAAFYEVNNHTFYKFDCNEIQTAPNGYIIRTNYSFSGKKDGGFGYIRFQTATELFFRADSTDNINCRTIMEDFSRSFRHSLLDKDFKEDYLKAPVKEQFINSEDLITRYDSSSTILVKGVKPGEDGNLATIWTHVGFPDTCVAMPVWVAGGSKLPFILLADDNGNAPLNRLALELKKKCYPVTRASGSKYMRISALFNSANTGIIQKIEQIEDAIFKETEKAVINWQNNTPDKCEIVKFYKRLNNLIINFYSEEFGLSINPEQELISSRILIPVQEEIII